MVIGFIVALCSSLLHFPFHCTAEWEERWVQSKHKSDYGKFKWTSGKFYGDEEKDKGRVVLFFLAFVVRTILHSRNADQ